MYDQAFGVSDICHIVKYLYIFQDLKRIFTTAFYADGHDGTGTFREIFLSQFKVTAALKTRV